MPSVFTIEGLTAAQLAGLGAAQNTPTVHYPPYGSPLAPHGAYNVGSTRPPTLVFNAEQLITEPPLVRWPERGPITDYGDQYAPLLMNHPYVNLGDHANLLHSRKSKILTGLAMIVSAGIGVAIGTAVSNHVDRKRGF